ncbi:MAG: 4Fe-4S dicluster domain-containing protein [Dehalococcoidia bacterium]|nr:4Fe-4S dicluster domain-containing protein [Dehalococcoidia bacterium]
MTAHPKTPLNLEPGFLGPDSPREEDLYRCVHCGLCLSACPTYVELGLETESPRGRIALMKAVKEGRLGISERVASHWDLCLQCRACEAVCPSGVPFGRLMEHTRAQVARRGKRTTAMKLAGVLFLRGALPHPRYLRLGATLMYLYQRSGLQALLRRSRLLDRALPHMAALERSLPAFSWPFFGPSRKAVPAVGETKMLVGLLSGCVMPLVHPRTMEASVRVLARNGCRVRVPTGQGCCGALNLHSGDPETARAMARRNIDVFLEAGVDRVAVASAGCGSTMKEYGELLRDDPVYAARAERVATMTVDISELLVELSFRRPEGQVHGTATYQDSCHLAHAQRITRAPRTVLESIPGLDLVEMESSDRCCGAAGIYSVTQREFSNQLLDSKMERVAATGADIIATANPGCVIQLENGLRRAGVQGRVCHVVDILDEAYAAEAAGPTGDSRPSDDRRPASVDVDGDAR